MFKEKVGLSNGLRGMINRLMDFGAKMSFSYPVLSIQYFLHRSV